MNFDLSEEQELLQETLRQWLENECPPARRREIFDGEDGFDPVLWKGLVELGLGGMSVPGDFGGSELELLDLAVAAEALGHAAAPGPFLGHSLAGLALTLAGSDEQQRRWLPALACGDALGSIAFAEENNRWQPDEWTLQREGAAGPRGTLTGVKLHVPYGRQADLLIVGLAGGELALVEGAAGGLRREPIDAADRTRRLDRLHLDGVSCEILPEGAAVAPRVRDAALVLLAADAFGGASRCVEMAVQHAQTREQFGVTIGHFQAVKHKLADMAVDVEPSRGLYWYAAHAFDHVPEEAARSAALAKAHLGERFLQVARDTVEVHGGIGFTWECDVQIWYKRALFDRAFLGTPRVHRERAAQLAGW